MTKSRLKLEMGKCLEYDQDISEKTKFIKREEDENYPTDFTDLIGGNGWWQKKVILMMMLYSIQSCWHTLSMSFLAFPVDHWCARPENSNLSVEEWWAESVPNVTIMGKVQHSQCEIFVTNCSSNALLIRETELCKAWEYSSSYNSLVNRWDLVCDREWMISACESAYMIGFLISVSTCGQLADIYGRHKVAMMNVYVLLIAGLATAFSNSYVMFFFCRFFSGFGFSGLELILYVLIIEMLGSKYRATYAFVLPLGWQTGFLSLPLIAWSISDWFYLQLAMILPCFFTLLFHWILPESPRWLLSRGQFEKAIPIMKKAAKMNGMKEINIEEARQLCYEGKKVESKATFCDLLRTPNLRRKTVCLFFIWISVAFTYYGLSLNTNQLYGNKYVNFFISGLVEIPAMIFCMSTHKRFGRKKPLNFALFAAGFSCLSCIFIPEYNTSIKTVLAMVGKLFITSCFSIIYIFSAEIFPTVARTVGMGSCSTVARIGTSVAPFMKDLGKMTSTSTPLVLFGAFSIISGIIVLKLPETHLQPVPETIDDAEYFEKKELINDLH